jgi:hypothetical protein
VDKHTFFDTDGRGAVEAAMVCLIARDCSNRGSSKKEATKVRHALRERQENIRRATSG